MKKEEFEKVFKGLTDEQLKELTKIEKTAYEKGKSEAEKTFEKSEFDRLLQEGIKASGAKNEKAVTALLDITKVYVENGKIKGLSEQIEILKKKEEYLFNIPSEKPQFTSKSSEGDMSDKKSFESMGYKKRLKLFSENPELYKKLTDR